MRQHIARRKLHPHEPSNNRFPQCVSIDQLDREGKFSLIETIPSTNEVSQNPELVAGALIASAERLRAVEQIWPRLRRASLIQRRVLVKLHGLDGNEPRRQAHIAKDLGVTRERVRQIELRLLMMLWPSQTIIESRGRLTSVHLAATTYFELAVSLALTIRSHPGSDFFFSAGSCILSA